MLSLKECNEVLNRKEKKYTQEQVEMIKNYLYQMAVIISKTKTKNDEEFNW
jgi:hypothetical protein